MFFLGLIIGFMPEIFNKIKKERAKMTKQMSILMGVVGLLLISGCATTRNYQPDIDSLNSKITALQAQLSEKDQEIAKLQNRLGDQEAELKQAESEKRGLSEKLSSATAKLDAASKTPESDLK